MKITMTGTVLLGSILLLGGCGLKGPLYLPEEGARATSAPGKPAEVPGTPDATQEPGAASGK